jgi:hypothetical protein
VEEEALLILSGGARRCKPRNRAAWANLGNGFLKAER